MGLICEVNNQLNKQLARELQHSNLYQISGKVKTAIFFKDFDENICSMEVLSLIYISFQISHQLYNPSAIYVTMLLASLFNL